MRKLLLMGAAILALTTGSARAQLGGSVVFCTNCTTPAFQLPEWLQEFENQAQMLQQQIQMVQYQIAFWNTLIQNTIDLPQNIFADITADINTLQGMVQQAEMIGQQTKFMIDHLSDPSGFGGDLTNWPKALAQENNSLANAMQVMGMAMRQSQNLQSVYAPQLAALRAQAPSGITQAVQIGNQIQATQAQQQSVYMNAQTVAFQALATAELRKAHRVVLLDSRALLDQETAVATECGYIVNFSPPACSAAMPQVGGATGGVVGAGGGTVTAPGDTTQPLTSFVTTAGGG